MSPWMLQWVTLNCLLGLLLHSPIADGYFGLTSKKSMDVIQDVGSEDQSPSVLCDRTLGLTGKQRRVCKRDQNISHVLLIAARMAARACQEQFQYERWNCSLGKYRLKILEKALRETSFLYAISSVGLVHAFARACSSGHLSTCTCEKRSMKNWKIGGCGDNIRFGVRFTKRLLGKAKKKATDFRARVDMHNTYVGIKIVNKNMEKTCRCHGPSGSCTVKTCWRQVANFNHLSTILKQKYENARRVMTNANKVGKKTKMYIVPDNEVDVAKVDVNNPKEPRSYELLYIDKSPNFCRRSEYTPGTSGRVCNKTDNCGILCCDRGYNVKVRKFVRKCNCKMKWCCKVECDDCKGEEEIHLCK